MILKLEGKVRRTAGNVLMIGDAEVYSRLYDFDRQHADGLGKRPRIEYRIFGSYAHMRRSDWAGVAHLDPERVHEPEMAIADIIEQFSGRDIVAWFSDEGFGPMYRERAAAVGFSDCQWSEIVGYYDDENHTVPGAIDRAKERIGAALCALEYVASVSKPIDVQRISQR